MCIDMLIDTCMDMCTDMRMEMCMDIAQTFSRGIAMCIDICLKNVYRHAYQRVHEHGCMCIDMCITTRNSQTMRRNQCCGSRSRCIPFFLKKEGCRRVPAGAVRRPPSRAAQGSLLLQKRIRRVAFETPRPCGPDERAFCSGSDHSQTPFPCSMFPCTQVPRFPFSRVRHGGAPRRSTAAQNTTPHRAKPDPPSQTERVASQACARAGGQVSRQQDLSVRRAIFDP